MKSETRYSSQNNGYHQRVTHTECTRCDYSLPDAGDSIAACSYGSYTYSRYNSTYHYRQRSCRYCNYVQRTTQAHSWNSGTQAGNYIMYTCTQCGQTKEERA